MKIYLSKEIVKVFFFFFFLRIKQIQLKSVYDIIFSLKNNNFGPLSLRRKFSSYNSALTQKINTLR